MARVEKFALHIPTLEELVGVLENGLKENFADVQVSVVDCPDLSQEPFNFPVKGICGNPRIADVGGVPYLLPLVQKDKVLSSSSLFRVTILFNLGGVGWKDINRGIQTYICADSVQRYFLNVYDLSTVAKEIQLPGAFFLGAGAVSSRVVGGNAEFIPLVQTKSDKRSAVNGSYVARINPEDGGCLLEKYSSKYKDCEFGLLANLYASEGLPGEVIEVKANRRTGEQNFISCIRKALEKSYNDKPVGMGGTFVIQKGKAKVHIMPSEFSACPLKTDEELNSWLKFFEMKAPLVCQSVLVSQDPGFDLRLEHTHGFSHHGEGGHYHEDTTPETVEYLGYFMPAEFLFRIDRPKDTHLVGRD